MEKIKLGDAATFVNGYPFKPTEWSTTGKEIIRIQNLTKSTSGANYFEGEISPRYRVQRGDLLISWSGTLGVFEWDGEDAWLNQHIFKVVFDKRDINKRFFKFLIESKLHEFRAQVHGATMQHITKGKFDNTPITLPPLSVQQRIADTLDTADALRRKDQELLRKYDDLAQSIFYEMFGDPSGNASIWPTRRIGDLANVSSGSTPDRERDDYFGGSINWVKTTEVRGVRIVETEETLTPLGLSSSSCKLFPPKTVLIAMYGQGKTRGQVGLLECEAATNQACAAILPSPSFEPIFLFYALKFSYSQLRELGRGGNQQNLNLGMVKDFFIVAPGIEAQKQFVRVLHQVENSIARVMKASTHSEHLFTSLLGSSFA